MIKDIIIIMGVINPTINIELSLVKMPIIDKAIPNIAIIDK